MALHLIIKNGLLFINVVVVVMFIIKTNIHLFIGVKDKTILYLLLFRKIYKDIHIILCMANKQDVLKVLKSRASALRRNIDNIDNPYEDKIDKINIDIYKKLQKGIKIGGHIVKFTEYVCYEFSSPKLDKLREKRDEFSKQKIRAMKRIDSVEKNIRDEILLYGVSDELIDKLQKLKKERFIKL